MPRYSFRTLDRDLSRHDFSVELSHDGAARIAAIRFMCDLVSSLPDCEWDGSDFKIAVHDDAGLRFTVVNLVFAAMRSETQT